MAAALLASLPGAPLAAQTAPAAEAKKPRDVDFTADRIDYDDKTEVVTATGNVVMESEGNRIEADTVTWNRKTGRVFASGNVRAVNPHGDIAYGETIELTDTLKDGVVANLLVVLKNGGRLAATSGERKGDITVLTRAAYTPCSVEDEEGCPKEPVWKITADQVTHDPERNRIYYKGAMLELFGLPIGALPGFSHPADFRGGTGFLIPDVEYSKVNGFQFSLPFHLQIAPNRNLTVTPHLFTKSSPIFETDYRALTSDGAYRIGGYATYGSRFAPGTPGANRERDFRGYFDASGRFQLDPRWSVSGSLRVATDRTFLRRYDISRDDRLRSTIDVQRLTRTSYFSLAGWGFQTLRPGEIQGQVPIALPIIDYRKRFDDAVAGGRVEFQLNTMAVARTSGQDTARGLAGIRWERRTRGNLGTELILTGYGRADAYWTQDSVRTATLLYRGQDGWQARAIGAAAAELRYPLVGPLGGGFQRITPRIQLVTSGSSSNLKIPNEDARSIDLEDSNLFALNRFAGYDRWEDGARITYGADWAVSLKKFSLEANIGQSYRLNNKAALLPDGTGLSSRTSDIVGRTTIKYGRLLNLTHRYRLDKDNLAFRRNEVDVTVGTDRTYATAGYLRLNRNAAAGLEDLRDREEIRLGGRIQLTRYWSAFGSTIIDLTGPREDPLATTDGYEPIRHRLGIAYEDDCLRIGITWRRDYDDAGDARRGNTFQIRLSFRNLGR